MDPASPHPELPEQLGWAALAAMRGAAAIKDDSLRYVWVNAAFCELFETTSTELLGATDDEVFGRGPLIPDLRRERQVLLGGVPDERYETLTFDHGRSREVLVATSRVLVDAEVFLVCIAHDITEVADANHSLVATTEHLAAESVELRAQAMSDPLTDLLNLRGFEASAPAALDGSANVGAVLMLDLDNFKPINDQHGHDIGDEVLRTVADALRSCTRRQRDVIARLGGDEFVVAMPDLPEDEAHEIVARIRTFIAERPVETATQRLEPAVSIGVAVRTTPTGIDLSEWRRRADDALYRAKRAGKDQAVITVDA